VPCSLWFRAVSPFARMAPPSVPLSVRTRAASAALRSHVTDGGVMDAGVPSFDVFDQLVGNGVAVGSNDDVGDTFGLWADAAARSEGEEGERLFTAAKQLLTHHTVNGDRDAVAAANKEADTGIDGDAVNSRHGGTAGPAGHKAGTIGRVEEPAPTAADPAPRATPPDTSPATPTKARRPKSRAGPAPELPLFGPTGATRSLVLATAADTGLDLTGDVGPVGRVGAIPTRPDRGVVLDLKGTLYETVVAPTNTALIVDMGGDAARVVAALHEVLWMVPEGGVGSNGPRDGCHLSGEEEEDGLADHQVVYSMARGGGGDVGGGDGKVADGGDRGEDAAVGGRKATRTGNPTRKRGRGGGKGGSSTPRKPAKRGTGRARAASGNGAAGTKGGTRRTTRAVSSTA